MKPIEKITAFILESDSKELPKKITEAIRAIALMEKWYIGNYYHWKVSQPEKDSDAWEDRIDTYLLNNGAKVSSHVIIHY